MSANQPNGSAKSKPFSWSAHPEKRPDEPTTREGRRISRAKYNAACWLEENAVLLAEYQQHKPADVIMGKMLQSLQFLEDSIEVAERLCDKETIAENKLAYISAISKLTRQHLETVKAIAKFQETYHAQSKQGRGNKSAAPGQQVGLPAPDTRPPLSN